MDVLEWKGNILTVGVIEKYMARDENWKFQNSILRRLDAQSGDMLAEASSVEDFTGKSENPMSSTTTAYRGLGEAVVIAAKAAQASNVAINLASFEGLSAQFKLNTALAIASNNRFKLEWKKPTLNLVDIHGLGGGPELENKLKYVGDVCSRVIFGKELENAPTNVLTPEEVSKVVSMYNDVLSAIILNAE
ncbi:hypothetical protein HHK36_006392 [Tetracentron sinense]|uniref:Uncharacterized protein n=1 Tax=Tetracentron sinense TaxID=13715 RepID=A0A834ZKD6_TETSI|nr:hypothetical protein HHK36_006392 [Tetracentron sinense]